MKFSLAMTRVAGLSSACVLGALALRVSRIIIIQAAGYGMRKVKDGGCVMPRPTPDPPLEYVSVVHVSLKFTVYNYHVSAQKAVILCWRGKQLATQLVLWQYLASVVSYARQ